MALRCCPASDRDGQYFQEKALGIDHLELAIVVGNLAKLYARGRLLKPSRSTAACSRYARSPAHPMLLLTLDGYAVVLRGLGRESEADGLDSRARKIRAAR
jgi:hypothetical protein